jgi:hypothetical protein
MGQSLAVTDIRSVEVSSNFQGFFVQNREKEGHFSFGVMGLPCAVTGLRSLPV